MIKNHGWLLLEDGDIVQLSIHVPSIEEVVKHWIEIKGRSFLCTGKDCLSCKDGIAKRSRYVANTILSGEALKWEFGEEVFRMVRLFDQTEGYINVIAIRRGIGRNTRYDLRQFREDDHSWDHRITRTLTRRQYGTDTTS